jgi:hypothetical protein
MSFVVPKAATQHCFHTEPTLRFGYQFSPLYFVNELCCQKVDYYHFSLFISPVLLQDLFLFKA